MENTDIGKIINEMADILEIKGENPFRIRSYRQAALTIETYSESLAHMVETHPQDLRQIPGIGESISKKIEEIVKTGACEDHRKLLKKVPPSMLEMLKISNVGPKKVALFHQKLKITDIDVLEKAAREGKLRELKGLGEKSEEKILKAIADYRRSQGRFRINEVLPVAEAFIEYLKKVQGVAQVEAAGSLRRRRETIGDLDLLVTCKDPPRVMDHFVKHTDVRDVLAKGETKSTVVLKSGLQVDVRALDEDSFGAALQYFTGSKEHNIALRNRAKRDGLKISEYGVFKVNGGEKRIAGGTEEEVYKAIGLLYIPPEMRENRGEIEAAEEGRLPRLIQLGDIKGDLHMHTKASDGKSTIEEMAREAMARGREYIAITDHSKSVYVAKGLDEKRLLTHTKEIDQVNRKLDGIRLLKGVECDILADGSMDLSNEVLARCDVVIAAVHSRFNMTEEEMTARICKAFENPHVDIFAHPTGRLIRQREPYLVDMEKIMEAARKNGVVLELNSYPTRLDLSDIHLKLARDLGVLIAINTDSHYFDQMENMKYGVFQARRGWIEARHVVNTLPLKDFLNALRH